MPKKKKQTRKVDEPSAPQAAKKAMPQDTLAKAIGKRIVEARGSLVWSQLHLHRRTVMADPDGVGISRSVLSLYETGVNRPGAREIVLLCEALRITPTWLLYGTESPAKTVQAAFQFLQGSDLAISARLAVGMLALDPVERDAIGSLLFSLLTKKYGDLRLSSIMTMAGLMEREIIKKVIEFAGDEAKNLSMSQLLDLFVKGISEGVLTTFGTLRPFDDDSFSELDFDSPPPKRDIK